MIIKQIPEDFKVTEIIDVDKLVEEKSSEDKEYLYYYLIKRDYTQVKAIDTVARIFNTTHKFVHVAGTKDRAGVTRQLLSIAKSRRMQPEKHLDFFNSKFDDLSLEYVGEFPFRLNLGDNQGNSFEITVRGVSEEEVLVARNRIQEVSRNGVLNFYDSQRFGYAGNSHLVGRAILKGDVEGALYEVVTSMPNHASSEHQDFVKRVRDSWESLVAGNPEVIKEVTNDAPKFLRQELSLIKFFHNARNDVSGAFRLIPKKLRTLYIGAYQAYLFNSLLKEIDNLPSEVELPSVEINYESLEGNFYSEKMAEDGLKLDDFSLPHMPELAPIRATRDTRVQVCDLEINEEMDDELNEGFKKVVVKFSLGSGSYATNVVKQLF